MIDIEEEKKKLAAIKEKARQRDEKARGIMEDVSTKSEPYTPPNNPEPVIKSYEPVAKTTDEIDPEKDIYKVLKALLNVLDRYDVFRIIISVLILSVICEGARITIQYFFSGSNAFMSFLLWTIANIIIAVAYGLLLRFIVQRSYKTSKSELKIQSILFCTYLACSVLSVIYALSENLMYINLGVICAAFHELYKESDA